MLAVVLSVIVASAAPDSVVAVGDDIVGGAPTVQGSDRGGGWVPVLADCLEERARERWTVRSLLRSGERTEAARLRVRAIREERPAVVVLALGGPETAVDDLDVTAVQAELGALISEIRMSSPTRVVLAGLLPSGDEATRARIAQWNAGLARVAQERTEVDWVDLASPLWSEASHITRGGLLTAQGHALAGATLCDAITQ